MSASIETTDTVRRRRFYRSAPAWPMQITKRDLSILAHLHRHRFLSSTHLAALDGGNKANVLGRLRKLFDSGYLERPVAQLATMPLLGPRPMVYALGSSGARLLKALGHQINQGADYTEKTKRSGAIFLGHSLAVTDFMVSVELACRHNPSTEIIREYEILANAPPATRSAREPLRWIVERTVNGKRQTWSVLPDGMFGLRFPDDTGTFFLLEIDRGSIPIMRSRADHRSITRKLATYIEGWRAGRHLQQFGLSNLRVCIVTSSQARMQHMLATVDTLTSRKGSGFLLFADATALAGQNPLDFVWTNGRRECVRLTE